MKRLLMLALPVVLLLPALASAELKLAVVDTQRAILASAEAQSVLEQLRAEIKPQEDQLKALSARAAELQEKMLKDGEVMSESERRKIQKEAEDLQLEYQFESQRLRKLLQERQQELLGEMLPRLQSVLNDLIEAEGYDMIVRRGSEVLYANPAFDITAKVTEKLNDR